MAVGVDSAATYAWVVATCLALPSLACASLVAERITGYLDCFQVWGIELTILAMPGDRWR